MTINSRIVERSNNISRRLEHLEDLPPLAKRLLLIRPTLSDDYFTRMSHRWSELVKAKAIAEGWEVEDLSGESATRGNIETALSRIAIERPTLVIHYDHGTEFTLYGHTAMRHGLSLADFVPVIDESNVAMTAGTFVSAMACFSAAGLGQLAIYERASGYLGYSSALWAGIGDTISDRFGEAVNAPNYALLEGRSPSETYDIGYQAWDRLCSELWEESGASLIWSMAKLNKDYFTLLVS